MRKKWLIIPALLLIPSCHVNEQVINEPQILYRNETIDDIKVGDKINVEPKTLMYQGQSKTVEGQIILPDGSSKAGKSFVIEMPGIYEVRYRAFFGVHEESASIIYHCHRSSGDFFISSNKDNPAGTGEYSHPITNNSIKGARLTLDSKTVFTYDGEIDFSSFNPNQSFIDFAIDTSKRETSDIEKFTIRLTDAEDSNNYVDITVTDSGPVDDEGRGCYMLAGSNNQFKTGYEGGRNGRFHISKYGSNVAMSFRDLPEKSERVARLYFDYANKELQASPMYGSLIKDILTDLDDKEIYGSMIWEGFKSGKATLSIFANSLLSNSATLIVSKIANIDLSPLDFVDEEAPIIKVNYNGQSSINVPKATVNKQYKIFDATVSDNYDRRLSYSTYVTYYDAATGLNRDVSVNNGYFTPKQEGKYTITYIAKDHSNNYSDKTVDVIAINDAQTMVITLDADTINQELYSLVKLPSISEVRGKISGGSGKPSVERIIYDIDGKQMEIEGDSFVPKKIGKYEVYYLATDYIGNISSAKLTVNITDPGHPVFIEEFSLPRVFIKGHTYSLPKYVGAEVINNETVYIDSKVYVNNVLLENNSFVADNNCEIKYQLNGSKGVEEYVTSIDVIDCGYPIDIGSYFYGNFSKQVNKDNVALSASSGDASALFASLLPYSNLYLKFALNSDLFKCDELVFKFSDSTDNNNSLSFHIKNRDEKTYISVGADETEYLFSSFFEEGSESFVIDFTVSNRALKDVYHKDVTVVKLNDQGSNFTGFNGGVYLDVYMKNIKGLSTVKMLTISNQVLGNLGMGEYYDFIEPIIILKDNFVTEQDYEADAYLPAAEVFDVFSYSDVTLSVRAPDNTYKLRNVDGKVSQTFVLDQFGRYIVVYTGTDSEGNIATYRRAITVYDIVPPELTINGGLSSIYGINSAINIPTYTVSDNLNNYTVDVFLIMPDNQTRLLLIDNNGQVTSYLSKDNMYYNSSFKVDERTFRAEQYGHYTLRFVAYDSDFNNTVKEIYFEVK